MSEDNKQQDTTKAPDQQPKSNVEPSNGQQPGLTKKDVEELLSKARSQERQKVMDELDSAKKREADLVARLEKMEQSLSNKIDLPKQPVAEPSPEQLVARTAQEELEKAKLLFQQQAEELAAQKAKLQHEMEERYREMQASQFKSSALKEANLGDLSKFVTGNTQEEIAASIAELKQVKESVQSAVAEKYKKEYEGSVPRPLAVDQAKRILREEKLANKSQVSMLDVKGPRDPNFMEKHNAEIARLKKTYR